MADERIRVQCPNHRCGWVGRRKLPATCPCCPTALAPTGRPRGRPKAAQRKPPSRGKLTIAPRLETLDRLVASGKPPATEAVRLIEAAQAAGL